jgi:2-hydroxy-6-oxonona-2,4-dienedioate hydrolase
LRDKEIDMIAQMQTAQRPALSEAHRRYEQAEKQLMDSLGLDYDTRYIELSYPPVTIRTLSIGQGMPVLAVCGGVGNGTALASLFAHMPDYRIITLDRPGAGLSEGIDHRSVNLRKLAVHTLEAVLDAYDLTSVPVISNSMGGLWAFWLGLDRPDRVKLHAQMGCPALILSTSAPAFMRLSGVPLVGNVIHNMAKPKDIAFFFEMYRLPTYDQAWKSLMQAVIPLGRPNARYALKENELRQVQQPVQFVWGDNDPFGDLDVARHVCDVLPNARLHTVASGHLPWLDSPKEVAAVFTEFIDSHV